MLLTVLLALQQLGTAPASFPVARVEIAPSEAEVEVGGQVRLAARALDAGGQPVKDAAIEWFVASGRGRIYSYVVAHEPFLPAFQHLLPLVLVLVEVDEGPRLVGYMVGCRPDEMAFGMRVRVVFERLTERVTLPVWEPER